MTQAWIVDGVRTPRGKGKPTGALHRVHPQELLAQLLAVLAERNSIAAAEVDDVIIGNGDQRDDHGDDIGRLAVLAAGWPVTVPGVTLNRFCGSGQQAVMFGAAGIAAGWQKLVVAGGVESMSRYQPRRTSGRLDGGNAAILAQHALVPQGISADLIASVEGFTREEVDQFALQSQQKAAEAIADGRFARSLVAVRDDAGTILLDTDEHPRPQTTAESLAALEPSFARSGSKVREPEGISFDQMAVNAYPQIDAVNHVHHAGNSSGVVDGAGVLLLAAPDYARAHGLTARASIRAAAVAAADPIIMLTAPGPASERCLEQAGMSVQDIDLWEINEAFGAVPLKVMRDLKIDPGRVNVNGGAIALGHPIGGTGPMLFQTVLDELERRDLATGLVTMCTGGGMATATIIERI
ncbi:MULTISPECIES: acetyl-CoA C-acetyltransferase [unclassified Rhodococcus (in: high G+C Gram-positive bacteria)]|uniref:acetyl-CoA C-acetyltransferase n=1 Tax=unclassified Rhodococcus (in: high G+C Gram-positive bacteria) TaxID=192944 RepID=UPI001639779D|nr:MULTISPECIES: acetyl-CoA C-acetyltransferase [unclassified Rhodococcus (in: high G+C Gram-positive bacteria)]MBC2640250.1 acetyl-CoA C-acetyltransferase [Rhodococcus sp. 3A]MBC2895004.1 acetyl-CoA C-acetyltransferase [Rhodococcus sp. 4CII]